MSPARLLRVAGLACVAAGVLLVVTQLLFSLSLVWLMATRCATRSPLVGVNGLLTLLAVSLLGLVGLYARQAAASGTLGLVGFLVAVLGTMLLAGVWWSEASRCRMRPSRPRHWSQRPQRTAADRQDHVVRRLCAGLGAVWAG